MFASHQSAGTQGRFAAFTCDHQACQSTRAAERAGGYGQRVIAGDVVHVARSNGETVTLEA